MVPVLFHLGSLTIYAYGFFILVGFITGVFLAFLKVKKQRVRIPLEKVVDVFFYAVLSAIIGSRALYVLIHSIVSFQPPRELGSF